MVNPQPIETHLYVAPPFEFPAMAAFEVRPLGMDHMPAFRSLRLDALRRHPEAFIPTWEEERAVDPSTFAARYRNDWINGGNFILGAFVHGRLVGAVGVRRWTRKKQRHRASVWILYTDSSARGKGIGRELLHDAISACQRCPEIESLHLSVSLESEFALRLYEDAGFRCYGVEPKAIRLDDRTVDVALMSLDLEAPQVLLADD